MRIITVFILVSLSYLVSAKYLPDESGSRVALRSLRSTTDNWDNSVESKSNESVDDDNNDNDNDDNDNDEDVDNSLERKRQQEIEKLERKRVEEQRKLHEKREKEEQKRREQQKKLEAKFLEERRKLEEKIEKEERKRREKLEKEERKREEEERKHQEKLAKEERKRVEEERKQQEKIAKEEKKRQEDINKKIENIAQETITSQNKPIDSAESEEDIDLEDIWKNYIYEKYGLTQLSTNLEKNTAINRYMQEELGLNANSTKAEYRQAVLQLVQNKLAAQQPGLEPNGFQNYLASHVNAVYIQKIQTEIEGKIAELDNNTVLLQNVSLPWVPQARYAIEQKRTILTSIAQYLTSILPNWITGNNSTSNTDATNSNAASGSDTSVSNPGSILLDNGASGSNIVSEPNEPTSTVLSTNENGASSQDNSAVTSSNTNPTSPDSLPVAGSNGLTSSGSVLATGPALVPTAEGFVINEATSIGSQDVTSADQNSNVNSPTTVGSTSSIATGSTDPSLEASIGTATSTNSASLNGQTLVNSNNAPSIGSNTVSPGSNVNTNDVNSVIDSDVAVPSNSVVSATSTDLPAVVGNDNIGTSSTNVASINSDVNMGQTDVNPNNLDSNTDPSSTVSTGDISSGSNIVNIEHTVSGHSNAVTAEKPVGTEGPVPSTDPSNVEPQTVSNNSQVSSADSSSINVSPVNAVPAENTISEQSSTVAAEKPVESEGPLPSAESSGAEPQLLPNNSGLSTSDISLITASPVNAVTAENTISEQSITVISSADGSSINASPVDAVPAENTISEQSITVAAEKPVESERPLPSAESSGVEPQLIPNNSGVSTSDISLVTASPVNAVTAENTISEQSITVISSADGSSINVSPVDAVPAGNTVSEQSTTVAAEKPVESERPLPSAEASGVLPTDISLITTSPVNVITAEQAPLSTSSGSETNIDTQDTGVPPSNLLPIDASTVDSVLSNTLSETTEKNTLSTGIAITTENVAGATSVVAEVTSPVEGSTDSNTIVNSNVEESLASTTSNGVEVSSSASTDIASAGNPAVTENESVASLSTSETPVTVNNNVIPTIIQQTSANTDKNLVDVVQAGIESSVSNSIDLASIDTASAGIETTPTANEASLAETISSTDSQQQNPTEITSTLPDNTLPVEEAVNNVQVNTSVTNTDSSVAAEQTTLSSDPLANNISEIVSDAPTTLSETVVSITEASFTLAETTLGSVADNANATNVTISSNVSNTQEIVAPTAEVSSGVSDVIVSSDASTLAAEVTTVSSGSVDLVTDNSVNNVAVESDITTPESVIITEVIPAVSEVPATETVVVPISNDGTSVGTSNDNINTIVTELPVSSPKPVSDTSGTLESSISTEPSVISPIGLDTTVSNTEAINVASTSLEGSTAIPINTETVQAPVNNVPAQDQNLAIESGTEVAVTNEILASTVQGVSEVIVTTEDSLVAQDSINTPATIPQEAGASLLEVTQQ